MINKNADTSSLKDIFKEYQENYSFVDSDFLKIYSYVTNDKVVAFLLFNVMYEKCEIVDIFVLKEYRNKGIASKLINEITNDYTVDNITLEVSMLNKSAINLYEKLGFKKITVRKNYYKDNPEKLKGNVKEAPAAQSLKMEKTAIQEVLDYAHRRGYIRAVPKINFKPRAKTENRATFTKKEYERLIMEMFMWTVPDAKASDSYQRNMIYNLIVFLANTGIRPSEYYKIKWKDIIVHSQNGIKLLYITVPENTKTGQRIVVSLPEAYTCYENIKSFSKYTKENDYVFTNYDGTSMKNWTKTYKSKLEEWQLYLDDEGNPRPPYSLRHYYATQRLLDGVQVYDLAKNMGTSVKQIENHYGHVLAIQKTNELIQGADISSLQNYQESEEYQIYLSEKEKNEQLLAKGKAQLAKLEKEHIQLIKETDELFKQSEAEIVRLEQEFEENLKEMDEKALQKSKKKLMKLCHKNKHHPELYANYTKQISRIDFYLEKFNQI